jgi:hypothetical protein
MTGYSTACSICRAAGAKRGNLIAAQDAVAIDVAGLKTQRLTVEHFSSRHAPVAVGVKLPLQLGERFVKTRAKHTRAIVGFNETIAIAIKPAEDLGPHFNNFRPSDVAIVIGVGPSGELIEIAFRRRGVRRRERGDGKRNGCGDSK